MALTQIDFDSFQTAHNVIVEKRCDGFFLSAAESVRRYYLPTKPLSSCLTIPKRFCLPLRIDMTLLMPQPGLHLLLGEGHISFGTQADNRSLSDIIEPDNKKPKHYYNRTSLDKDNEITVLYGLKFMQIIINGKTCYFSKKEKYMRAPLFANMNKAGFELKIGTDKFAEVVIKKMTVEEYDTEPNAIPITNEILSANVIISKGVKATFEDCIVLLSPMLQEEIKKTDQFLLNNKEFKIKRKIEGDQFGCKITYTSSVHGFSYALVIHEHLMHHFYWWYMLSNYKFEEKYMGRKNDLTNHVLKSVYELSPETADRLVGYYDKCNGCGQSCTVKTIYELNGKKFVSCHGKMGMNMNLQTFSDLRFMLDIQKDILTTKS
ncbi:MAG: hypothetical protein FWC16_10715 [Defluviitaleaceae bacterium]|nr:hypothetical protein [Defluviitaleaceae bacterium]MCL2275389.1 hypothetical protein [Defluviitaleaceae bacterium]